MRALVDMMDGLKALKSIIEEFPPDSSHWNEAQNRFQFVDRLLHECLGWRHPDVEVERFDEAGGRADYLLGKSPVKAVLEAKREAAHFEGVVTEKAGSVKKLSQLILASKEFKNAVTQVIPYCALHGAQLAIVCNGPQLAIFQAIAPGLAPLEGECFFFDGYQSYLEAFPLLWKLLSPEGISENRAYRDLALHRNPRIPSKASQAIPEPIQYRYRNALQDELRTLSSILLEEVEDNPDLKSDFYRECYVPIEANNRHLLLSKQIISARYKRVGDDGVIPPSLDSVTKTGKLDSQFTAGAGSRPIVVIGEVGVGKTSFFENLYQNIKSDGQKTYYIHIDLGKNANLSSSVREYIINAIPEVLLKSHGLDIFSRDFAKTIYHEELKAFDQGVHGSLKEVDSIEYEKAKIAFLSKKIDTTDSHIKAVFGHLSQGRNNRIILVLDNADQRTFDVQQETFLISQEIASSRTAFVFVALRPSTFYLSKTTGALSAYQNKILTISPPPADRVIEQRISFALRVAEGQVAPAALDGIRLQLRSIVAFLKATLRSIRGNDAIRQFLSNITGGNTRSVIEMITSFCGSPNVDAAKIVNIELSDGGYIVPLHEFTKHALLGEYAYFNAQSSYVACNVFDVNHADSREHFLSSLIVSFLSSNMGIKDNDGFVSGGAVADEMAKLGYIEDQTRKTLKKLAEKRLIETPYLHYREIKVDDSEDILQFHFRATSIGIYHVRYWTGSFAFLDATSTDTPIFDDAIRRQVMDLASSFEIAHRSEKTILFKGYLESQWHAANIQCNYYNFTNLLEVGASSFDMVQRAVSKVAKHYTRGRSDSWRGRA